MYQVALRRHTAFQSIKAIYSFIMPGLFCLQIFLRKASLYCALFLLSLSDIVLGLAVGEPVCDYHSYRCKHCIYCHEIHGSLQWGTSTALPSCHNVMSQIARHQQPENEGYCQWPFVNITAWISVLSWSYSIYLGNHFDSIVLPV